MGVYHLQLVIAIREDLENDVHILVQIIRFFGLQHLPGWIDDTHTWKHAQSQAIGPGFQPVLQTTFQRHCHTGGGNTPGTRLSRKPEGRFEWLPNG